MMKGAGGLFDNIWALIQHLVTCYLIVFSFCLFLFKAEGESISFKPIVLGLVLSVVMMIILNIIFYKKE